MNNNLQNLFENIRKREVHFNRGKYTELLHNTSYQQQVHSRFSMFSTITRRMKIMLLALSALTVAGTALSIYALSEKSKASSADAQAQQQQQIDQQTATTQEAEYETVMYMDTPKNYPHHVATSKWAPTMKANSLMVAELQSEDYEKIGLQLDAQGALLYAYKDQKGTTICRFVRDTVSYTLEPNDVQRFRDKTVPSFYPHLITDTLGVCRFMQYRASEVDKDLTKRILAAPHQSKLKGELMWEMSKKANGKYGNPNTMIALLIRTKRRPSHQDTQHWLPDVLLWYEATPELMAALPKNLVVHPLATPITGGTEKVRMENSNVFFDMRSPAELAEDSTHAVFNISAFPNPVQGRRLSIRYELHSTQNLTFSLHDINGREIDILLSSVRRAAGVGIEELTLPPLETGVYLIGIKTSSGEMRSERIFVER